MWQKAAYILIGFVAAPLVKQIVRPVLREVVRGGVLVVGEVQRASAGARENLQDMAREAAIHHHTEP
jgi:hypothetical protein